MHLGNILGFGLLGLGMTVFPTLVPGLFPPEAGVGMNLSGRWLQFMGWVNGAVGGILWVRYSLAPRLAELLVWRPIVVVEHLLPGELLRPAVKIYPAIAPDVAEASRIAA